MNILFLTSRLPYPPNRGDKLRVFNFIKHLSRNHSITLVSFIESREQMAHVRELKKFCQQVEVVYLHPLHSYFNCLCAILSLLPLQVAYYASGQMSSKLKELCAQRRFESVYIHLFRMAEYADDLSCSWKVIDLCDAVSLSMQRTLRHKISLLWPVYALEWLKIRRYEALISRRFNEVIFISEADKKAVVQASRDTLKSASVVANGVTLNSVTAAGEKNHHPPRVAFLGYLNVFYNLDAILYFYYKIFPKIKEEIPGVKFSVIGAHCPEKLRKLQRADAAVELYCDVADTGHFLRQASVFVCPLRVGAGLQNKILEAMSAGLPVVTTTIGNNGLGARADKEIIVEDEPMLFAQKVVALFKDSELSSSLAENARKFIEQNFRWETAASKLEAALKNKER